MTSHIAQLASDALLRIKGPDALTFLQGQTTADTRELSEVRALPGVYCTPQGRVVCDFLLCTLNDDDYGLRMRASIRDHAAKVLSKYIVFSKAELIEDDSDWQCWGLWGDETAQIVRKVFAADTSQQFDCHRGDGYVLIQRDDQGSRFECLLHQRVAETLISTLREHSETRPEAAWQALDIASGIARIEQETIEEFVPQVLNFDLTGHISFTKGCYTGQEVVARLHYRGRSKRRSYLSSLTPNTDVSPGLPLYCQAQSAGHLVNHADGMALVSATEQGMTSGMSLEPAGEPLLKLQNPPYPFPEGDQA
ncbi:MAG: hypothetical protein AAGA91_15300 [Pseudomonadota bacterium]